MLQLELADFRAIILKGEVGRITASKLDLRGTGHRVIIPVDTGDLILQLQRALMFDQQVERLVETLIVVRMTDRFEQRGLQLRLTIDGDDGDGKDRIASGIDTLDNLTVGWVNEQPDGAANGGRQGGGQPLGRNPGEAQRAIERSFAISPCRPTDGEQRGQAASELSSDPGQRTIVVIGVALALVIVGGVTILIATGFVQCHFQLSQCLSIDP